MIPSRYKNPFVRLMLAEGQKKAAEEKLREAEEERVGPPVGGVLIWGLCKIRSTVWGQSQQWGLRHLGIGVEGEGNISLEM